MFTAKLYYAIMHGELSKNEIQLLFAFIKGAREYSQVLLDTGLNTGALKRSMDGLVQKGYVTYIKGNGRHPYSTIELHLD